MIDEALRADAGRRAVTDVILGLVTSGTAPLWFSPREVATSLLLYGSLFIMLVRLYGMIKDWWRGRQARGVVDDD
jgi:hypothetical protein